MAKATPASFLSTIYGSLHSQGITFRRTARAIAIQPIPIPTYGRSEAQDAHRALYSQLCEQWHTLTEEEKAPYETLADDLRLSAFNAFLSVNLLTPPGPEPVTVDLPLSHDTWVDENSPTANRNTHHQLVIGKHAYWDTWYYALSWPDLSQLPANCTIQSAQLYLYFYTWTDGFVTRNVQCHRITTNWTPSTVTWNTRPSFEATPMSSVSLPATPAWYAWDVTAWLQSVIDAEITNYGLLLKNELATPANQYGAAYSLEGAENHPYLKVTYLPP